MTSIYSQIIHSLNGFEVIQLFLEGGSKSLPGLNRINSLSLDRQIKTFDVWPRPLTESSQAVTSCFSTLVT